MAQGWNKHQSRKNRARVCDILMREWDPIGVAGVPEAAGEYDTYANKAYAMLIVDHASAEEISAYLFEIATEHMELASTGELAARCDRAAQRLLVLRPEFETH